jgi:hypothetical protein
MKIAKKTIIDALVNARLEDEHVTLPCRVSFSETHYADNALLPRLIDLQLRRSNRRVCFTDNFPRVLSSRVFWVLLNCRFF